MSLGAIWHNGHQEGVLKQQGPDVTQPAISKHRGKANTLNKYPSNKSTKNKHTESLSPSLVEVEINVT